MEAEEKELAPAAVAGDGEEEEEEETTMEKEGTGCKTAAMEKDIGVNQSQTKCFLGWRI